MVEIAAVTFETDLMIIKWNMLKLSWSLSQELI